MAAQFQSEIELRVKVLDKELDQLEKRIAKVANPFTASGGARNDKRIRAAKQAQRAELSLVQQAVEAEDRLRESKAQKRAQTNLRRVRFLRDQRIKAANDVARAEEAAAKRVARKREELNRRVSSGVQGALISSAFPLLTGEGGNEAIFGGIGGLLGGIAGGPLGSFAGGIAGSAIGKLVTDAENLNRELAGLNARLGSTGTAAAVAAGDISELARQLNITKEEAVDLAGDLVAVADAAALQDVAQAFGPVGGASTFEAIAKAGLDEKSALEAIDSLRGQIGLKAAEELTNVLETQGAVALQAALLDEVLRKSQEVTTETAKQVTIWDRINFLVQEYLLGVASASSPQGLANQRAEGIEPPEIGVLDGALTKYEEYLKKRNALNERYNPKRGRSAEDQLERQLQAGERLARQFRQRVEILNAESDLAENILRITHQREEAAIRIQQTAAASQQAELLAANAELGRLERIKAIEEFTKKTVEDVERYTEKINDQVAIREREEALIREGINPQLAEALAKI